MSDDAGNFEDISRFWRQKLADYFQNCPNLSRKCEEYLYQVCGVENFHSLVESLCEWPVFDSLYDEEFSHDLLNYWRKVCPTIFRRPCLVEVILFILYDFLQAGELDNMAGFYKAELRKLEKNQKPKQKKETGDFDSNLAQISKRYECVARVL